MIESKREGIWLVCAHHERGMLKRIFGDSYRIVLVGQNMAGGHHCGIVITEWARTECMGDVMGQEWLSRLVNIHRVPYG